MHIVIENGIQLIHHQFFRFGRFDVSWTLAAINFVTKRTYHTRRHVSSDTLSPFEVCYAMLGAFWGGRRKEDGGWGGVGGRVVGVVGVFGAGWGGGAGACVRAGVCVVGIGGCVGKGWRACEAGCLANFWCLDGEVPLSICGFC